MPAAMGWGTDGKVPHRCTKEPWRGRQVLGRYKGVVSGGCPSEPPEELRNEQAQGTSHAKTSGTCGLDREQQVQRP